MKISQNVLKCFSANDILQVIEILILCKISGIINRVTYNNSINIYSRKGGNKYVSRNQCN